MSQVNQEFPRLLELSEAEHRELYNVLKNQVMLKYLNYCMHSNSIALARSPLPEQVTDIRYLIAHATTKGVLLFADTLLKLYEEGVAKYGSSSTK